MENRDTNTIHRLQLAARVSQVPRQAVSMGVEVTACASEIAVSRQAGVVQKPAAFPHGLGFRVEADGNASHFGASLQIYDAHRFIKAVEHIQALPRFVDGQSSWPLTY